MSFTRYVCTCTLELTYLPYVDSSSSGGGGIQDILKRAKEGFRLILKMMMMILIMTMLRTIE